MSFKKKLARLTGIRESLLPSSYQIVGDILLLKLPKIRPPKQKNKVAESMMKLLPYVKTVCEIKGVEGEFREPNVSVLSGNKIETIHTENSVQYKLDVSKIMFSKGNLNERKRIIPLIKEGEIIVDMFAGIGYFSLGIAKFTKAREVLAIEKNPVAYNYLADNIAINKISVINAMQGDCKLAAMAFRNYADRIIMGYFPHTEEFLPYALFMTKNTCIIHFHNIYKTKELWTLPFSQIDYACKKLQFKHKIINKKKVKSYSPNTYHVVIDFKVIK